MVIGFSLEINHQIFFFLEFNKFIFSVSSNQSPDIWYSLHFLNTVLTLLLVQSTYCTSKLIQLWNSQYKTYPPQLENSSQMKASPNGLQHAWNLWSYSDNKKNPVADFFGCHSSADQSISQYTTITCR